MMINLKEKNPTACSGRVLIPWGRQQHIVSAHPDVIPVLAKAIAQVTLPTDGSDLKITIDLGRSVGRSGIVKTDPIGLDEETTFAVRNGRDGPSRVVVGILSPEVTTVGIIAVQAFGKPPAREVLPGKYILVSAWIGTADGDTVPEPWDPSIADDTGARDRALAHWSRHAFEYGYPEGTMGPTFTSTWRQVIKQYGN